MSHAFYRTAQGRLPKPMSSKGKTTFSIRKHKNKLMWHFSFDVRKTTKLCFSSKVAWAAIGWVVDTEPGFISYRWLRKEGAISPS